MASDNKTAILEGTLQVYNEKGIRFTMDDLAKHLGMSKKTIYVAFKDKQELFLAMVEYVFDAIAREKDQVLRDDTLGITDKIRKILGVMPDKYMSIDFKQLHMLSEKFPEVYQQVAIRLESGWEPIIELLEQGMASGKLRQFSIPLFKMILETSISQFFARDILIKNDISYNDALDQVVSIIVEGIIA